MTWVGGDAFRSYVPSRLEHFVSPDFELSVYPSGLLLRGKAHCVSRAHTVIAESVVHTEGLQNRGSGGPGFGKARPPRLEDL